MRGSRKFRRGGGGGVQVTGPGQSDKKSSDNVFFIPEGSNIFEGVQLFRGGPIAYSYRNPFNL